MTEEKKRVVRCLVCGTQYELTSEMIEFVWFYVDPETNPEYPHEYTDEDNYACFPVCKSCAPPEAFEARPDGGAKLFKMPPHAAEEYLRRVEGE